MKTRWMIITICALVFASCDKDDEIIEDKKTAVTLLTSKAWLISMAGFDDNKNGIVDAAENVVTECQADNTYTFHIPGTGAVADNALTCGAPVDTNFNWSFEANETRLKINSESNFLLRLNEQELILKPDWPWLTADFLIVYRH